MEITTGRECKRERWNPKTGRLTGTKEDIKSFMAYLDNLQAMVYRTHSARTILDKVSFSIVKQFFLACFMTSYKTDLIQLEIE